MSQPETLYYCKLCGRHGFVKKTKHRPPPGVVGESCPGDFAAISEHPCFTCAFETTKACPDASVIRNSPYRGCNAWVRRPENPSGSALAPVPKTFTFKKGDPDQVAADFKEAFAKTERASKVVAAFGVLAAHVKYNLLRHGQFGDWVEAQCGEHSYRSVRGYMQFAESVLEKSGVKSLKGFVSKWQDLPICHRGEFLLEDEKKVPEAVRPVRQKALDVMANKTVNQLFFEFKQAEEDPTTGAIKPKRGNMTGKGNPKENREKAQQANEKARIEAIELKVPEVSSWLLENADDQHFGQIDETLRAELLKALDTAAGYLRRFAKKGSQQ